MSKIYNSLTRCLFLLLLLLNATIAFGQNISGDTAVCANTTNLYTYPHTAGNGYDWSVTPSTGTHIFPFTNHNDSCNIIFTDTGAFTIRLIVYNNGHSDTFYYAVNAHADPKPSIVSLSSVGCNPERKLDASENPPTNSCFLVCDSTSFEYQTQPKPGSVFHWSSPLGGAIFIDSTTFGADHHHISVTWGAASADSYTLVVEEEDSTGCTGLDYICIRIVQRPHAKITLPNGTVENGDTVFVCLNSNVTFSADSSTYDISSPINYWYWTFTNNAHTGNTSIAQNEFGTPGNFTVTLIVRTVCGCSDTVTKIVVVDSLAGPVCDCPSTVCPLQTETYTTNDTCATGYMWDVFGENNVLYQSNDSITVQWGDGALGFGSLAFTSGCPGFCPYPTVVVIPIVPSVAQITGNNPVCQFSSHQYSVPNIPSTTYYWEVKVISGNPTPYINIIDTLDHDNTLNIQFGNGIGLIEVTVNFINEFLGCGGKATDTIRVRPNLTISGPVVLCVGSTGNYTTNFSTLPMHWCLKFPNGSTQCNTGTSTSYSNTFTATGSYVLTAEDLTGNMCNTATMNIVVFDIPASPVVTGPSPICPGTTNTYQATSPDGTYVTWQITGGTPATASGNQVSITWNNTGPYIITASSVMLTNPFCQSPSVVLNIAPKDIITPTISGSDSICVDAQGIQFSATLGADQYHWDIDVNVGAIMTGFTDANPTAITTKHDVATGLITVTATTCGITVQSSKTITLIPAPPSTIAALDSPFCTGSPITFQASNGSSYTWNFGDGSPDTTTTSNTIDHIFYNDTSYTVTVVVQDPSGCLGESTASLTLNVLPSPVAVLTFTGSNFLCLPDTLFDVNFYVTIQNGVLANNQIIWYRNGSPIAGANSGSYHATTDGVYQVEVMDTTTGCSGLSTPISLVNDTCPPDTLCPTLPLSINYQRICNTVTVSPNLSSGLTFYDWWFEEPFNGEFVYTSTASHTYNASGYYHIKLTAYYDYQGDTCFVTDDTIIHIPVFVNFTVQLACTGNQLQVNLLDNSNTTNATISHFSWSVDGNIVATTQNTTVANLDTGNHTVTLTVISGTDTCSFTRTVYVPALPTASFTWNPSGAVCENIPITFIPTGLNNSLITSYLWDFGDQTTSALDTTTNQYPYIVAGYYVSLIVYDVFGCYNTVSHHISIAENSLSGYLTPTDTSACVGNTITIQHVNDMGATPPTTYSWSQYPGGIPTYFTNPITVTQSGSYTVSVSDQYGCSATYGPAQVALQTLPIPQINGLLDICRGTVPRVHAFVPSGLNYTFTASSFMPAYMYTTSGSGANSPVTFTMNGVPAGATSLACNLTFTDPVTGCTSQATSVTLTIHDNPVALQILPNAQVLCANEAPHTLFAYIDTNSFNQPVTYSWSTGEQGQTIQVFTEGVYTVTASTQYGCTTTANKSITPGPDFSQLIYGCFERCDSAIIPGPKGLYTYLWLLDGQPISTDRDITVTVSGSYQLILTTIPTGCTDTSRPINMTILPCDTMYDCCNGNVAYFNAIELCFEREGSGQPLHFPFSIYLNYGMPYSSTFTLMPSSGTLVYSNTNVLHPGINTITGIIDYSTFPLPTDLCMEILIRDSLTDSVCHESPCIRLPHMNENGICDLVFPDSDTTLVCVGTDLQGNPLYHIQLDIGYLGSNNSTLVFNSSTGTFTSVNTNNINFGINHIDMYYTDLPPYDGDTASFRITVIDSSGSVCSVCFNPELPSCDSLQDCGLQFSDSSEITCDSINMQGQPVYHFHIGLNYSGSNNATLTFQTSQGTFSPPTVSIHSGFQFFDTYYTDDSGSIDGYLCLDLLVNDSAFSNCSVHVCFGLPTSNCYNGCGLGRNFEVFCLNDTNGHQLIGFNLMLYNPYVIPNSFTVTSNAGPIINLSPDTLGQSVNLYTGTIDNIADEDSICIEIILYMPGLPDTFCMDYICVANPCRPDQCYFDSFNYNCYFYCFDDTLFGVKYHTQTFSFYYHHNSPGIIHMNHDPADWVISPTDTIYPGFNTITVIYADTSATSSGWDSTTYTVVDFNGDSCTFQWFTNLDCPFDTVNGYPACDSGYDYQISSVECEGNDPNGHPMYSFTFSINNPTSDTLVFFTINTINTVGFPSFSPIALYLAPGTHNYTVTVTVDDDSEEEITWQMVFLGPCGYCVKTFTFEFPGCNIPAIRMKIIPNPANDRAVIDYDFINTEEAEIFISDIYGNKVAEFRNIPVSGKIELNTGTYQSAVYFVSAIKQRRLIRTERLVILK